MAKLPTQYQWLLNEDGPKMIKEALALIDVKEDLSVKNNPTIMDWAKEVGGNVANVYLADSIPWCGLFMAVVAKRAGKLFNFNPLWALSWAGFGEHIENPELGDVLVFTRTTPDGKLAGHVALYVGEDAEHYHCLGGNQTDKVCIQRKKKTRLYKAVRPQYNNKPANIRRVFLMNTGEVSNSEQ